MSPPSTLTSPSQEHGPAWEVAKLFPNQGDWSEDEFLNVTDDTNRMAELTDGHITVLTMPKMSHQLIVAFLYGLLAEFVRARDLGTALFAPLRVRLRPGVIREPDIVFMLRQHTGRMGEDVWEGADLVMEVVSEDSESRDRDLVLKRREYAQAGIPEYWIVDPQEQRITVLKLEGREYAEASNYGVGDTARSVLLSGFEVEVAKVIQAGKAGAR